MAAPWSCAVTPSWGPSKSSWSSNSSSICRRNHHHASPRQQRRFPSHPTPCSGDFRDASVDIAHFFTPVEKVGLVVHTLANGPARTSQLRRQVGGISEKMLIQTLRRLERNGFVSRRAYPEVPPRVEYSLTALGASLSEPITTLDRWVENHLQDIAKAQLEFDRHDE